MELEPDSESDTEQFETEPLPVDELISGICELKISSPTRIEVHEDKSDESSDLEMSEIEFDSDDNE